MSLERRRVEDMHFHREILNVEKLLSYIDDESKIISEEVNDSAKTTLNSSVTEKAQSKHTPPSSIHMMTPIPPFQLPLSPKYHPTRQVAQVWDRRYRLPHFESVVFPPGFIDV